MIRLGTSSYIIEDTLIENVRYLASLVDDIELVLFETPESSNIPGIDEIHQLNGLAAEHDLTYTVHLPMDAYPGSRDEKVRISSVDLIVRVIERTRPLNPLSYIFHLTPEHYGAIPAEDMHTWLAQSEKSVVDILRRTGIDPFLLGVETLSYPLHLIDSIIRCHGAGITLDIGHLHLMGYDVEDHIKRYADRCRVFHLHGVDDGMDHLGLHRGDRRKIDRFLDLLESLGDGIERVVTLEVFDLESFEESMGVLHARQRGEKTGDLGDRGRTKWKKHVGGSVCPIP
ncbi:MAG: sugar phosphate isomerase/epimerase [Spirochaetales bacterium]|nr:sugar phosphate isomerase/epimerase [Spirochaetales bacterium]